jgi:hypothetical protein
VDSPTFSRRLKNPPLTPLDEFRIGFGRPRASGRFGISAPPVPAATSAVKSPKNIRLA